VRGTQGNVDASEQDGAGNRRIARNRSCNGGGACRGRGAKSSFTMADPRRKPHLYWTPSLQMADVRKRYRRTWKQWMAQVRSPSRQGVCTWYAGPDANRKTRGNRRRNRLPCFRRSALGHSSQHPGRRWIETLNGGSPRRNLFDPCAAAKLDIPKQTSGSKRSRNSKLRRAINERISIPRR
jgi:hypothetical protein